MLRLFLLWWFVILVWLVWPVFAGFEFCLLHDGGLLLWVCGCLEWAFYLLFGWLYVLFVVCWVVCFGLRNLCGFGLSWIFVFEFRFDWCWFDWFTCLLLLFVGLLPFAFGVFLCVLFLYCWCFVYFVWWIWICLFCVFRGDCWDCAACCFSFDLCWACEFDLRLDGWLVLRVEFGLIGFWIGCLIALCGFWCFCWFVFC